ncbi:hypothetical protein SRIMM317S_02860 [Streptomyces rimosus subsp. rimosus]
MKAPWPSADSNLPYALVWLVARRPVQARRPTQNSAPPAPPTPDATKARGRLSARAYPAKDRAYRNAPAAATRRWSKRSDSSPASGRTIRESTASTATSAPTTEAPAFSVDPAHSGSRKSSTSAGALANMAAESTRRPAGVPRASVGALTLRAPSSA